MENFIAAAHEAIAKVTDFKTRTSRNNFWYAWIIIFAVSFVSGFIFGLIRLPFLSGIVALVLLVPGLSLLWRRMHDIGKPGYFGLIPLYNIYLAIQQGEDKENEYGPAPEKA